MKSKLLYLIGYSIKKKMKGKAFIISNIVVAILLIALVNIHTIIGAFSDNDEIEYKVVHVIDNTNAVYDSLVEFTPYYSFDKLEIEFSIEENTSNCLGVMASDASCLIINEDEETIISAELVSYDSVNSDLENTILNTLNVIKNNIGYEQLGVTSEQLQFVNVPIELSNKIINSETSDEIIEDEGPSEMIQATSSIMGLPFFMLVIFLIQMIGMEITDEKSSRGMEMIISSVSPKIHFISKIIAGNLFVLMQSFLMFVYGIIGIVIGTILNPPEILADTLSFLNEDFVHDSATEVLPLIFVLYLVGFILYSMIAAIVSSTVVNVEDYQQIQAPIMITLLIGYYISIFSFFLEESMFLRIVSYIPFISPVVVPTLYFSGILNKLDILISLATQFVTIFLLYYFGIRVYKEGILNYSNDVAFKRLFKIIKNSKSNR